jgi:hypothetical protein
LLIDSLQGSYNFEVDFVGSSSFPSGATFDNQYNGGSGYYARKDNEPSISVFNLMSGWLSANPPDIILLHIGTNDVSGNHESASEIADILNVIDAFDPNIYVVLGLITNRLDDGGIYFAEVSSFNTSVNTMAQGRTSDLITVVDMEHALDYDNDLSGDLLHPDLSGYTAMANVWLGAIADLCLSKPLISGPGNKTFAEGASVSQTITANDPDNDPIVQYGASNLPPGLTVNSDTGLISGTISYSASDSSPYSVEVTAEDDTGAVGSETYTWTITNTNRPPVVDPPGNQSSAEGGAITPVQIDALDPDGNGLSFDDNGTLPDGLSIDASSGLISGVLDYDSAGFYPVVIVVTDDDPSNPLSDSVNFTWTVSDTNRAPLFAVLPGNQANNEGEAASLQIQASDLDPGDSLNYSAGGLPEGLAIDPSSGLISGALSFNASTGSPHLVSVTVSDGSDQATANFTWQVSDRNGAPQVVNPGGQTDAEMHPVSLQIQAVDPDLGDSLSYTLAAGNFLPPGLQLSASSGLISGMIAEGASSNSPYSITVIVMDDGSPQLSGEVNFLWNVVPYNVPPGDQETVFLPLIIH